MKIITFTTLDAALSKQKEFLALARHATSPSDLKITPIFKHPKQDLWFMNYDDCVTHGGSGKTTIAQREGALTVVSAVDEKALELLGYIDPEEEDGIFGNGKIIPDRKVPDKTIDDYVKDPKRP
jgi:hypothetical protein